MTKAIKVREIILSSGEGNHNDKSAFEMILAGRDFTDDAHKARRTYPLGMSVNPQKTECGMEPTNAAMLQHQEDVAVLARTATSQLLHTQGTLDCNSPQALPVALVAWGTLRNQYEWLAKAGPCNKTR